MAITVFIEHALAKIFRERGGGAGEEEREGGSEKE